MCPPASTPQVAELSDYWTDELVFKSLSQFKSGCSLPSNVTSDVDPYRCTPSNLGADMWYFCSGAKEGVENGFWLSTGEAREIFSDPAITGFRKTLQFYEGQAPYGQKTNWMMQEYTTTEKYSRKLDSRALCRVFLAEESGLVHSELPSGHGIADIDVTSVVHPEMPSGNRIADIDVTGSINPGPNTVSDDKHSSGRLTKSKLLEKNMDDGTGPSAMANRPSDPPLENVLDIDYVLMGDYLELDDLADPLSHSSSSADSSCMTMTSEDFFDLDALMHDLGDDAVDQEIQDSRIKFNLSTPAKSKEVVMPPTNLGSLDSGEECKPCTGQTSKTDHTPQNEPGDHRNECTSNSVNTTAASSSSSEGSEKKDRVGRTKKRKVMKYLCFLAF